MHRNRILTLLSALLLLLSISSCNSNDKKQKTNWQVDLRKESKNPYGLYLAYNSLSQLFPGAAIEELKSSYRLTNLGYRLRKEQGKALVLMVGLRINFNKGEIDSLFSFIAEGHQVMLVAADFDDSLLQQLNVTREQNTDAPERSLRKVYLKNNSESPLPFSYTYRNQYIHSHFEPKDTSRTAYYSLGLNEEMKPDCILYAIGKGRLFLHAAPSAFTNYFLLQGNNKEYLSTLFSYIPEPVEKIYWSDFDYRKVHNSDLSIIWNNPSTRYALLIALFGIIVYLLFEIKRRQKIIPVIAPVENSSVAFVETIGRLYYNKKNHTNLAEKMIQHFLEFVRGNYFLNTSNMDEEFVRHLAAKAGKPVSEVSILVESIKEIQGGHKADESYLYSLHTQIQSFYHGK
jgi:hypothetical protein